MRAEKGTIIVYEYLFAKNFIYFNFNQEDMVALQTVREKAVVLSCLQLCHSCVTVSHCVSCMDCLSWRVWEKNPHNAMAAAELDKHNNASKYIRLFTLFFAEGMRARRSPLKESLFLSMNPRVS